MPGVVTDDPDQGDDWESPASDDQEEMFE